MRLRSHAQTCVTALAVLLSGCAAYDMADESAQIDRQVALYLYPPAGSSLPIQVRTDINLEAGTYGVVPLYPGVTVTGSLLLPVTSEDGMDTTVESVFGTVTATDTSGLISYEAQLNLTSSTFQMRVPPGTYDLTVDASLSGYAVPPQRFPALSLMGQGGSEGEMEISLDLDPGTPLQVTLTYTDGLPVSGARVYTVDDAGFVSSSPIAAQDGVYWIQVAHGTQALWMGPDPEINPPIVHTRLPVPVATEESAPAVELEVGDGPLEPLSFVYPLQHYRLSGRVTDNLAAPVQDVTVYATRVSTSVDPRDGAYDGQATTDEQGHFTLQLPEGSYELLFRASGNELMPLSGTRLDALVALNADVALPADVTLLPMESVVFEVRAPDGSPVAGASLTLVSDDQANPSTSGFSDENGAAELLLGLGAYVVEVTPPQDSELARSVVAYNVVQGVTTASEITLEEGFAVSLQFQAEGVPVSGLLVRACEFTPGYAPESPTELLATTVTDDSGNARLVLPQN